MRRLWREWTLALRSLKAAPGHTATCAALLALGVASTTAIVTVGEGLLRRPLPVREDERLIVPYGSRGDDERLSASAIDAEAWREAPSFAGFAVSRPQAVTLEEEGEPVRLRAASVEAGFFPLLGVEPIVGRGFAETEARAGAQLVVLSHGLWQRRFGGDPGIVGTSLRIEGGDWEVVGVMEPGFDLPFGSELWRPLHLDRVEPSERGSNVYDPVARLAPGRSLEDARAELAVIARRLEEDHPDTNAGWGARAITLRQNLLDDPESSVERAIALTFWGAAFLLLIACANVAQLQIVRAASRQGELGTRLALGASRASLARTLIFETLALSALATLVSLPLAYGLARGLARLGPVSATAFSGDFLGVSLEPQVLGVVVAAALLIGLAAGIYPALRIARSDLTSLLTGGTRTSTDRGRHLFLEGAVLAQVAVTVTLLSATSTLGESYALLRGLDLGFRPDGLSYYELSLAPSRYEDRERRASFVEALALEVGGLDGVESASVTTNVPLSSPTVNWIAGFGCEGRELAPGEELLTADRLVGPGYLETLGVRLLAGRTLNAWDTAASEPVAVINRSLADECWPGQDPVGKRVLRMRRSGPLAMKVVGVVADPQEQRVSFGAPHSAWYLPYRQHGHLRDAYLVVRGEASPSRVRAAVHRLDPHQPVAGPRRVSEHLDEITGSDRLALLVMGYFAALSLVLVGVGIHGSMWRFVGQQHRAIGVRMAFGAEPGRIVRAVVGRGLALSTLGTALGLAGAAVLHRLTAAFVYGALLATPARLALTAVAILLLTTLACVAPAARAARIDPAHLLRGE